MLYSQMASRSFMPQVSDEVIKVTIGKSKGKVCIQAKWPIRPELILVSVA